VQPPFSVAQAGDWQEPPEHTFEPQSVSAPQFSVSLQLGEHEGFTQRSLVQRPEPQSPGSVQAKPSPQVGVHAAHTPAAQTPVVQSPGAPQVWPMPQVGAQAGAWQRFPVQTFDAQSPGTPHGSPSAPG